MYRNKSKQCCDLDVTEKSNFCGYLFSFLWLFNTCNITDAVVESITDKEGQDLAEKITFMLRVQLQIKYPWKKWNKLSCLI